MKNSALHIFVLLLSLALTAGCNSGGRSGNGISIPGVSLSAAPLPEDNRCYVGPNPETLRYSHTATTLKTGRVFIAGGSDEAHLTSLDTAEIFDQTLFAAPQPETITGDFVSTDFVGDPILLLNGGRLFHSSTLLPNGNVLVAGGTPDALIAFNIAEAEVFDVQARQFNTPDLAPATDMIYPRFGHTATLMPNGKVLFIGGQESVTETIINPNFPPGDPQFQIDLTVFPSTKTYEWYNPANKHFEQVTSLTGITTELDTPRGRSYHASVRLAGFDNRLGTGDDVVLIAGGYQTFSSIFAPQFKYAGQFNRDLITSVEYFDAASGSSRLAPGLAAEQRTNGAIFLNVGTFRDTTPDGVEGVANVGILFGGDDDGPGGCAQDVVNTEQYTASFTGFGPANGIQFLQLPGGAFNDENVERASPPCFNEGRIFSDGVMLPARRQYDGETFDGSWAATGGGGWVINADGCPRGLVGTCGGVITFELFDPFYNVRNFVPPPAPQVFPWDLTTTRSSFNPTGVRGTWLMSEDLMPSEDYVGYADAVMTQGQLNRGRMLHTLNLVPGEDGIPNTIDDRIVVIGGGQDYWGGASVPGGDTVGIGCEIYLAPGTNGF